MGMDQAGIEDSCDGDEIGEELILDVIDDHLTVPPEQDWATEMRVEAEGGVVDTLVLWQFGMQSLQDQHGSLDRRVEPRVAADRCRVAGAGDEEVVAHGTEFPIWPR